MLWRLAENEGHPCKGGDILAVPGSWGGFPHRQHGLRGAGKQWVVRKDKVWREHGGLAC